MPLVITEIHQVMEKIRYGIKVNRKKVCSLMNEAIRDKANFGIWIKREINGKVNYASIIIVGENSVGERKLIGYRIERRSEKSK